jgi:hypothetical protein
MTPDKNGWIYIYSGALQMKIAFQESGGGIVCEDKTPYSMKEAGILAKAGLTADPRTHLVKKVFECEIVEVSP